MKSISNHITSRKVNSFFIILFVMSFILAAAVVAQTTDTTDITMAAAGIPNTEYKATQLPAEVGKPVQWVKRVDIENMYDQTTTELSVNIPEDADKITAVDVADNKAMQVTVENQEAIINDSLEFNEKKTYLIRYETPAPEKTETPLVREGTQLTKNVVVSSEYHYQDILTYTQIPEMSKSSSSNIRLYWQLDGTSKDVTADPEFDVRFYDTNGDGRYDRMSWMTPHLSTQIFEVVIYSTVDAGNYTNIAINLLSPTSSEYIRSNTKTGFNYSVQYNSSTLVYCNLSVDSIVKQANIPTASNTLINTYFNLSTGEHSWKVNCAGSDGATNTSETRTFTIDVDTPTVTLNVPDYYVSSTGTLQLNFTTIDNNYPVMICALSINNAINRTGIIASNNTLQTVSYSGVPNGVYKWNVSCDDGANNRGASEQRTYYISTGTPSEYNISPNKDAYAMGESGYFIISAKPGSNLTMFIDSPTHDSSFRYFNGRTFPIVEPINFTSNSGTYNIDGIFMNSGNMYVVKASFTVTNNFEASIGVNDTKTEPDQTLRFKANSTGGIGNVTFDWDFDDNTTTSGSAVDHAYSQVGEYIVRLTATDAKGNKATEEYTINVFNLHNIQIVVREKSTQRLVPNITVEVDDERKNTDQYGSVNFSVYEGKRRIYIANEHFDWVKQVRNITEDEVINIDLVPTGTSNYTYDFVVEEASNDTTSQENDTQQSGEVLLAEISAALETMESKDAATKQVMEALGARQNLETAQKDIRQILRDIGNTELSRNLTTEERNARIANITKRFSEINKTITGVDVLDTAEYVDYAKSSDVSMLSAEYIRFRKVNYSNREKEGYIKKNTEMQSQITIKTRLAIAALTLLSGDTKTISIVINDVESLPNDTTDTAIVEYVPKEIASSTSDMKVNSVFETVKSDPILKFSPTPGMYSYYVEKDVGLEELKKTKHVLLKEPLKETAGLLGVTGFSIFPNVKFSNPKLALEILIMVALLLAYLAYQFEAVDRVKEYYKRKRGEYSPDANTYDPTKNQSIATRMGEFIRKEETEFAHELTHIRALMTMAHAHAKNNRHEHAEETYKEIMEHYKILGQDAKAAVHMDTKAVYNSIMLSKINHSIEEAFKHIDNNDVEVAKSHYSEIKQLYSKLGKEHRATVSDKCIKLHEKIFELSLN